jgi:hypothetical protein
MQILCFVMSFTEYKFIVSLMQLFFFIQPRRSLKFIAQQSFNVSKAEALKQLHNLITLIFLLALNNNNAIIDVRTHVLFNAATIK